MDKFKPKKSVMFPTEGGDLCKVIYLSDWIEESREARVGHWISDRIRFERKIRETDQKMGWIS
jgi:hypothetical protein